MDKTTTIITVATVTILIMLAFLLINDAVKMVCNPTSHLSLQHSIAVTITSAIMLLTASAILLVIALIISVVITLIVMASVT